MMHSHCLVGKAYRVKDGVRGTHGSTKLCCSLLKKKKRNHYKIQNTLKKCIVRFDISVVLKVILHIISIGYVSPVGDVRHNLWTDNTFLAGVGFFF